MKLATVRVEYTCGLTLTDRASLDVSTGEVYLPPRLVEVMAAAGKSECSPAFSLEYRGEVFAVRVGPEGGYDVPLPQAPSLGFRRILGPVLYPTKDQRQQNGRLLHTFCAASVVGMVGYSHAIEHWSLSAALNAISLASLGVILWYAGFQLMKGD